MSMTLEEAIVHAEEIVDRCEVTDGDRACAEAHRQLAEWLSELHERRKADNEIPFGNNAPFSELDSIINAYEIHGNHKKVVELLKELRERRKQPEIIRCKDCENWDTTWQNDFAPNYHYCPIMDGSYSGDFYCAKAERRTDEQQL